MSQFKVEVRERINTRRIEIKCGFLLLNKWMIHVYSKDLWFDRKDVIIEDLVNIYKRLLHETSIRQGQRKTSSAVSPRYII